MQIKYGLIDNNIDVTSICNERCKYGNFIVIPAFDYVRCVFFTDPLPNVLKSIFVVNDDQENDSRYAGESSNVQEYDFTHTIIIGTINHQITTLQHPYPHVNFYAKLVEIQNQLQIRHGSFSEEFPEQLMSVRYFTGKEKVLELGGNIGRNSLIIASILQHHNNFDLVTLESDPNTVTLLTENRDVNNLQFHIEGSALSNRKLMQNAWTTLPINNVETDLLEEYTLINTITYQELQQKYNIQFDTLVLDCEGAFYYILQDMPEILENIKLIVMENDYLNLTHKQYIDDVLKQNGFYVDYVESGGWGQCYTNFYEVWKRF